MAKQHTKGMEHLFNLGVAHKDLAARNVIINAALMEVKVSYPALCKDVYAAEYFSLSGRLAVILVNHS